MAIDSIYMLENFHSNSGDVECSLSVSPTFKAASPPFTLMSKARQIPVAINSRGILDVTRIGMNLLGHIKNIYHDVV
jgi:hypothetical protein